MFKIFFICLFVILILTLGGIYVLFNSPLFWQKAIVFMVNPRLAQSASDRTVTPHISELTVGQSEFQFPGNLEFKSVSCVIIQEGNVRSIHIERLVLKSIHHLLDRRKYIQVLADGLTEKSFSESINKAQINLRIFMRYSGVKRLEGQLKAPEAQFSGYQLTNIHSPIIGDEKKMEWSRFSADFYNGKMEGQISIDYSQGIFYSAAIKLVDVDLKQMQSVQPRFFSQIQGHIDGYVSVLGDGQKITTINAFFNAPGGGVIKASLLNYLLEYLPQSSQKEDLSNLIKAGGHVPLEKARVDFKNLNESQVVADITLGSRRFNLDINLTVDINVEGGLGNLLNYLKKIK